MGFKEIDIKKLNFNPFTKLSSQWALVSAGTKEDFNTMTISWGGFGVLWGKNTATIYIRPQRYTKKFIDSNDRFTLSFFDENHKDALKFCGTVSRNNNENKIKDSNLTPYYLDGTASFEEADMIFVCKKLYHAPMPPENFDAKENDAKWYPNKDYHIMYIAEIEKVLVKA